MCQAIRELLEDAQNSGIEQKQIATIRNMLSLGLPIETICSVVECSPEYIEKVRLQESEK